MIFNQYDLYWALTWTQQQQNHLQTEQLELISVNEQTDTKNHQQTTESNVCLLA